MNTRSIYARLMHADIRNYIYFVLSTGLYQTYRGWVSVGRPNPHLKSFKCKDPTSRAEISDLFELEP